MYCRCGKEYCRCSMDVLYVWHGCIVGVARSTAGVAWMYCRCCGTDVLYVWHGCTEGVARIYCRCGTDVL